MILVTGAPRSGTSLVCQVLAAHGVDFGGPLVGAGKANPHGFWEHKEMRKLEKRTLESMGFDPRGQHPLPPRTWHPTVGEVDAFRDAAIDILGDAEAYKGAPKILLLWPLYRRAFPEARWIFVWRDPVEVARSCQRTSFMRAFGTVGRWERYVIEIHDRAHAVLPKVGGIHVRPGPCDPASFRPMVEALGMAFDDEATIAVCDPTVWGGL